MGRLSDGVPVLDAQAKAECKCRLNELRQAFGSKSNGEGEVGAGLEVVAALREELLPGDALLVAHSPRA